MEDLCLESMLYNIKPLYLHRVFHGIRFKVNNWRLAVRDGWLFSFIGVPVRGGAARCRGAGAKIERKMQFFCRRYCRIQNNAYLCTAIERDCEDIEIKIWCVSSAG